MTQLIATSNSVAQYHHAACYNAEACNEARFPYLTPEEREQELRDHYDDDFASFYDGDVTDWADEQEYNLQDHQAHVEEYWGSLICF